MTTPTISYKKHRFPPSIIARAVWLYFRFPVSLHLVEEMLPGREIAAFRRHTRFQQFNMLRGEATSSHHNLAEARNWQLSEVARCLTRIRS